MYQQSSPRQEAARPEQHLERALAEQPAVCPALWKETGGSKEELTLNRTNSLHDDQ